MGHITFIRIERVTTPHLVSGQPMPLNKVSAIDIADPSFDPSNPESPFSSYLLPTDPSSWTPLGQWKTPPLVAESIMTHLLRRP